MPKPESTVFTLPGTRFAASEPQPRPDLDYRYRLIVPKTLWVRIEFGLARDTVRIGHPPQ